MKRGTWLDGSAEKDWRYGYNGKELIEDVGLNWLRYGARWYDAVVGRFTGVDPVANQFAWVNPYNYAENSPVRYVDLWGLQKGEAPLLRGSLRAAAVAGLTGLEVNLLGAKSGVEVCTGCADILSINAEADNKNGASADVTVFFNDNKETFGVSGGDIFGGELSFTFEEAGESPASTFTTSVNLGLFYIKNELTTDSEGNTENNQYLGIDFGVSAGAFLGFDISASLEFNITPGDPPEGWNPEEPSNIAPQDNTRVNIPILNIDPQ